MVIDRRTAIAAALLAVVAPTAIALLGRTTSPADAQSDRQDDQTAIAATVDGNEVSENQVTDYIERFRSSQGLTEESSWRDYLKKQDLTPDTLRSRIIESYVSQYLVNEGAEQMGVAPTDKDIDRALANAKALYGTDNAWQESLDKNSTTEEEYRENLQMHLAYDNLEEALDPKEEPNEDEMLDHAKIFAKAYDGAKKSSDILMDKDAADDAERVLELLKNGEMTFADAAARYSSDATADRDGNLGWDVTANLSATYKEALARLDKGEISDLIEDADGIHIIMCTDVYNAPDEVTSLDQIPEECVQSIRESLMVQARDKAFDEWYEQFRAQADVAVNPMPEGLPYDIDMDLDSE